MSRRTSSNTTAVQPAPQSQHPIVMVSIRELCEQPTRFNIDPPYQRKQAWKLDDDRKLIDTILNGRGIGILEGCQELTEIMQMIWEFLDGHQRTSAIRRFYNGEYKTWSIAQKKRAEPYSELEPVEPGKFFSQMSIPAQNTFLDYHLPVTKSPNMSRNEKSTRFLDIQTHSPLTPAERLNAFWSKAKDAAREIEKHSFWEDFYSGEMQRQQVFQSSLYLLALEMSPDGYAPLRSNPLVPSLASGKYDDDITDALIQTVLARLDDASCIYSGMQFTDRATVIAMYQSIIFLGQHGYTIRSLTDKAKLTSWITSILDASKRASGLPTYHQPVQRLLYVKCQQEFWERHLNTILIRFGLAEQPPPLFEGMEIMQV